jgi:hypothetical protein
MDDDQGLGEEEIATGRFGESGGEESDVDTTDTGNGGGGDSDSTDSDSEDMLD